MSLSKGAYTKTARGTGIKKKRGVHKNSGDAVKNSVHRTGGRIIPKNRELREQTLMRKANK